MKQIYHHSSSLPRFLAAPYGFRPASRASSRHFQLQSTSTNPISRSHPSWISISSSLFDGSSCLPRTADPAQELFVKFGRRRTDMFQVAKDASRVQHTVNLRIQRPLPLVSEMMNGETGNYRVKLAQLRQMTVEIVRHDRNRRVASKPLLRSAKHDRGEINRHRRRIRMVQLDQVKQASVARAEVEDALRRGRDEFQKC